MELYDAKMDKEFSKGYVDIDEKRVRKLDDGTMLPFRYMHGGFEGTTVKFSFCFPEKEAYEGRFYQYLSPFPGPEEEVSSLPVTGIDDKIAFCLTHGAYYVESNMGSIAVFVDNEDPDMTHRSSAAAAEFSRVKAQEVYGYQHRPYGYVYGGSGGGYRTIACIENTNAFDGAAPYVVGSPYAIPNCQTTRAHAERILRTRIEQIIDRADAGGSENICEGFSEEEKTAYDEFTKFGFPEKSWFINAGLDSGSLSIMLPRIKMMDPEYFEDFWKKPGYLGTEENSSAVRDRICMDTKVKNIFSAVENVYLSSEKQCHVVDTRNGVNDAWKKMIRNTEQNTEPWLEVENIPVPKEGYDLYVQGLTLTVRTGKASGKSLQVKKMRVIEFF